MFLGIFLGSLTNAFESLFLFELVSSYLVSGLFDVFGQIFINLLKLLVVPLVFVSLVCGVGQVSSGTQLGSIGFKSALLYMLTTSFAICSALLIASFFSPGAGINIESASTFSAPEAPSLKDTFINIFPTNPVSAMSEGNMLQIIVFALLFGYGLLKIGDKGVKIKNFLKIFIKLFFKL